LIVRTSLFYHCSTACDARFSRLNIGMPGIYMNLWGLSPTFPSAPNPTIPQPQQASLGALRQIHLEHPATRDIESGAEELQFPVLVIASAIGQAFFMGLSTIINREICWYKYIYCYIILLYYIILYYTILYYIILYYIYGIYIYTHSN
jgi:hypothetical protein